MRKIKLKNLFKISFTFILLLSGLLFAKNGNSKVALLYSNYTEKLLPKNSTFVHDQITFWELFFIQNKIIYSVITDEELEAGLPDDFSVLVLPNSIVLSDAELSNVKLFFSEGNSVFANKIIGEKDQNGKSRGKEILNNLFGISYKGIVEKSELSKIHSINGGNALSINIPVGFRLRIDASNMPIKTKINSTQTHALGYWYNDDFPYAGLPADSLTTAIAYGTKDKGKFVWIGFDFTDVVGTKIHQEAFNNLLINSISWLESKNSAWVEAWPKGEKSAVIVSCDVEFEFDKIINATKILNEENIAGQYYILTDVMTTDAMNQILQNGDVGLHGDNHDVFQYQSYNQQYDRIEEAKKVLEKTSGRKILGFRPPETVYDENSIEALKKLQFNFLASDYIEDRSVPQFYDNENDLLVIPQTGYDDYDILIKFKIDDYNKQAERYLLDYNRVNEEGGLYVLNYHSQLQCLKENVQALKICIDEFKKNNSWIATANDVNNWWRKANNLSVSILNANEESLTIELKNKANFKIEDAAVGLYLGSLKSNNNFSVTSKNKSLKYDFNSENNQIKIYVDEVSPFETKIISVQIRSIQ